MATIKRDDVKQKWEDTEFPLVCETCLGDNPYVRMTKEPFAKKCKICDIPFTVFAWQSGTKGRLKKVEICRTCAQTKNVCQVCIYDLQYGLPVQVRDKVMREHGAGGSSYALVAPPQSDANQSWFAASQSRALENGTLNESSVPEMASMKLQQMARMEPRYERNLPKICTFYARGECDRGSACPFRHEMPRDRSDPMAKQSTKDRYYGKNDPVASAILNREKDKMEQLKGEDAEPCTIYIRFGDENTNPITEMDLRDHFYSHGEIVAIRFPKKRDSGAFVEYTSPSATELAVAASGNLRINNRSCFVSWARAPKRGDATAPSQQSKVVAPLSPPGVDGAAKSALSGFKPSSEVAAAAAARRNNSKVDVPRPGGGPIRRNPASVPRPVAKPYYPSQNPSRLGSRTSST